MRRPQSPEAHLLEPNYYRLAYQLSAQQLHLSLVRRRRKEGRADDRWAEEALESARRVVSEGKRVLDSFEHRERLVDRWWPLYRKRLDAPERRLQRFLAETVVPCGRMVAAIVLAHRREFDHAESHADVVRRLRSEGRLSFRALYNLACYEVAVAESGLPGGGAPREPDDAFAAALSALGEALRRVVLRSRTELVEWARKDPGLKALDRHPRHGPRFRGLLERYVPPDVAESSPRRKPSVRLPRRPRRKSEDE
jgi:hypothetical protein